MIIFSGSSNHHLATQLAGAGSYPLGECEIGRFANDEKDLRIMTDVAGQDVAVVQSFSRPVDSHIIELLLMADALERSGAKSVTAIIPWMGYSLQDKVFSDGQPLSARVVADMVSNGFVHRVILVDLHNPSIAGFFSVPTIHVRAMPLFVNAVHDTIDLSSAVVVSPDFGGLKASRVFAEELSLDLVNVNKHRDYQTREVTTVGISGDVAGKVCLLFDDVVNTGGTVVEVAKTLKEHGAAAVHFYVTHGLFAGDGLTKMQHSAIDSVTISDTIEHPSLPESIHQISIVGLLLPHLG